MSPIHTTEALVVARARRCALPTSPDATFQNVFEPALFDRFALCRHRVYSDIGLLDLDGEAQRRVLPQVHAVLARRMEAAAEAQGESVAASVALAVVGGV